MIFIVKNIFRIIFHLFHPNKINREHIFIKITEVEFTSEYQGWVNAEYSVICPICNKYESIIRCFYFDTAKHLLLIQKIKSYPDSGRLDWLNHKPLSEAISEAENYKGDNFTRRNEVMK